MFWKDDSHNSLNQMEAQFVQCVLLLCTFLSIIVKIKLQYFVHRKLAERFKIDNILKTVI